MEEERIEEAKDVDDYKEITSSWHTGLMHVWTQGPWQHVHNSHVQPDKILHLVDRILSLTKKLFVTDAYWERQNQFSPGVSLAYQPYSSADLCPGCKIYSMFLCAFCFSSVSFCMFVCFDSDISIFFNPRKNMKLTEFGGGRIWEELWEGKTWSKHCIKIKK